MKNILIRGPLLTNSGYGVHSRQIFRWLIENYQHKIYSQVTPWGITPWHVNPNNLNGLVGKIMATSSDPEGPIDISIQIQLPNEWDPTIGKVNIGVTAGVETTKCNPNWITHINRMTAVVVPSNFAKKTLQNSGNIMVPVYVIPEAFYDEILTPSEIKLDIDTDFNFLMVGQLTNRDPEQDRKNLFYGLKWLCETFKDDPSVGVILKTNHGTNTTIDRRIITNLVRQLVNEIRPGAFPKVHLLHGALEESEMAGLYQHPKVKAIFSPTRGEGWGLPLLEAAASGLPVIATDYSGHLDFLNVGKFIDLDYDLVGVHRQLIEHNPNIFVEGAQWAHPKEIAVKKRLLKFRKAPHKPKEWADEMKIKIQNQFSHRAVSLIYEKFLGGYFK